MTKANSRTRARGPPRRRGGRSDPPQISSNITLRHVYRFVSSSGTATVLTPTSLLCAAGTMGTALNTSVTSFVASVRINRVTMWTPPASQGATATCSVNWNGYQNSPDVEMSDTTVSVSRPARVSCVPPRGSLAAFWQTVGTNTICTLVAPTGTIIDVDLSLILSDDDPGTAASTAVATAAVGGIYYLSLDPNATHRYVPVSLFTTF